MEFDVIVIGGGASGLFCAAQCAGAGLRVAVLEKRERPARKLMITGKGRCNLTNDCAAEDFFANVPRGSRFLRSAAAQWSPQDTMRWFMEHGVPLKVERGRRVFPVSDRAADVVDALVCAVRAGGGEILQDTVTEVLERDGAAVGVLTESGARYEAGAFVVATGGLSYPATGSTGDGYKIAQALGHTIAPTGPTLVQLITTERDITEAAGLSLKNVTLSLFDKKKPKKPVFSELGELLFTHTGISGPLALTASSLADFGRPEDFSLLIDLKPALSAEVLDRRILRDFEEGKNRDFCNSLGDLLPRALIPIVVQRSKIPPQAKINAITREQRHALCAVLKCLAMGLRSLGDIDEAVITRGGVALSEIVPGSMRSKLVSGVYFTGEVIDADALTGGFNLQIAFCTAYAAAADIIASREGNGRKSI